MHHDALVDEIMAAAERRLVADLEGRFASVRRAYEQDVSKALERLERFSEDVVDDPSDPDAARRELRRLHDAARSACEYLLVCAERLKEQDMADGLRIAAVDLKLELGGDRARG